MYSELNKIITFTNDEIVYGNYKNNSSNWYKVLNNYLLEISSDGFTINSKLKQVGVNKKFVDEILFIMSKMICIMG